MASDDIKKEPMSERAPADDFESGEEVVITFDGLKVNASGHPDQLQRGYELWSTFGLALSVDNAWVALGTSLVIAICTARTRINEGADADSEQITVAPQASSTSFSSLAFTTPSLELRLQRCVGPSHYTLNSANTTLT
jgi:hypothetical protein